jgi:hypothetical protein
MGVEDVDDVLFQFAPDPGSVENARGRDWPWPRILKRLLD